MKRKEFIYKSGATALLLSLGVNLVGCSDDPEDIVPTLNGGAGSDDEDDNSAAFDITTNPFDVLQNIDSWLLHPEKNILIANVNDNIRAFSSICPHSGCTRDWSFESSNFICGCHGSTFTNQGSLISGPATRGLTELDVVRNGDLVTISG